MKDLEIKDNFSNLTFQKSRLLPNFLFSILFPREVFEEKVFQLSFTESNLFLNLLKCQKLQYVSWRGELVFHYS